jgi:hypothetical protein
MQNTYKCMPPLIVAAVLTACGGGGGDESTPNEDPQTQATNGALSEAQNYVSSQMRDPTSVVYRDLKVYRLGSDTTVCGQFNAKNGFGAYGGYRNFYYRPSEANLFKFIYQTNETGASAYRINRATDKLIASVCSNVAETDADLAQAQFLNEILP